MNASVIPFTVPIRGVHIDCRAQMPRFPRLVEILNDLARWGYNAVLLEYEDHFPFRGRLKSIAAEDALTPCQVKELDRIARSLGLQIIPLVQSLGHLTYVLRLPQFRRLTEGHPKASPCTVCPAEPKARALFRDMVEQILEFHPDSRYFHIGGDEAILDHACPRCCRQNPKAKLSERLIEHYLDRADWVRRQGPDPILWCDMALAHPEHLERLRGRAIIMDWDYWSGINPNPTPQVLWGIGNPDPKTWAPLFRNLYQSYVFMDNGQTARPFPYSKFLHDQGFAFMIAPAARCSGDSFCVPCAPLHSDNVVGAVRAAVANRSLGCIITSWALRRAPWPLTEYTLIAGSLALKNPSVSRKAIDLAFVREHFGTDNLRLARIPYLLGVDVPNLLQARPISDLRTNLWLALAFHERIALDRKNLMRSLSQLKTLQAHSIEAENLLTLARPRTARQRERVAFWRWAIRVLSFYATHSPAWLSGEKPVASLQQIRPLAALSARILRRYYTDHTLKEEQQTRFGSLQDYLQSRKAQKGPGARRNWRKLQQEMSAIIANPPPIPSVRVPRFESAIEQGDWSRVDWTNGVILDGWRQVTGMATARKIQGRLIHDGVCLYIRLEEAINPSTLHTAAVIWAGDDWELFFSAQRGKGPYRQIAISPEGKNVKFAYGEQSKEWVSDIRVLSHKTAPDRWIVTIAFPLGTLLPGGVKPGQKYYANFYRASPATGLDHENLAWSPNFDESFQLDRLGEFTLE